MRRVALESFREELTRLALVTACRGRETGEVRRRASVDEGAVEDGKCAASASIDSVASQ